jgi:hypothetical protein
MEAEAVFELRLPSQETGVPALLPLRWDAAENADVQSEKEAETV